MSEASDGIEVDSRARRCRRILLTWLLASISVLLPTYASANELDDARAAIRKKDYATARALFQPLAERGNVEAQVGLGISLIIGGGNASDRMTGVRHLEAASDAGSSDAQTFLSMFYLEGKLIPRDVEKGVLLAKRSSDAGNTLGKTVLAMAQLSGFGGLHDDAAAVDLLRTIPLAGNALVTYELGKASLVGRGTAQDISEGERLLREAARLMPEWADIAKLLVAQRPNLSAFREGRLLLSCRGMACAIRTGAIRKTLKRDFEDGQWLELAARVSSVGAPSDQMYFYLGRAAEGIGDLKAAEIYYGRATSAGTEKCDGLLNNCDGFTFPSDAEKRFLSVKAAMRENERIEVEQLAFLEEQRRQEAERAALAAEAQRLAAIEQQAKDAAAAFDRSSRLARGGSRDDMYLLAQMYFHGDGTATNAASGIQWLRLAAKAGHAVAQAELGERLRTGKDVARDEASAEQWLQAAVKQGNDDASIGLAEIQAAKQLRAAENAAQARKLAAEREQRERKRRQENAEALKSF